MTDSSATFPFAQPQGACAANAAGTDRPPSGGSSSSSEGGEPSPEAASAALRALKEALAGMPHDEKSSLMHVQRVRPELVGDDHLLGFLRAEDFDVELALKRLLRYWEQRRKVFGPDKFALPMTLNGAMKDHIQAVKEGFLSLLPVLDSAGRAIIYLKRSVPGDEKIKVWWYLLHVASENPSVAKKGFVILGNGKEERVIKSFDPKWALVVGSSGDRIFPIRWRMAHVCHMRASFPLVASAIRALLSPRQRETFLLHNGSDEAVLKSLSEYSLSKRAVPTDLGGDLCVSTEAFVNERLAIEGGSLDFNECGQNLPEPALQMTNSINAEPLRDEGVPVSIADLYGNQAMSGCIDNPRTPAEASSNSVFDNPSRSGDPNPMSAANTTDPFVPHSVWSGVTFPEMNATNFGDQTIPAPKRKGDDSNIANGRKRPRAAEKTGEGKAHPGRSGDPRMNLALQAKLNDSNLTLVDALVAGGFVFPDLYKPGVSMSSLRDVDNISMYQRRNQLIRRMRSLKKLEKG